MGYAHDIPGGAAWSARVRAGRTITFTADAADANLSVLLIGADRLDRLNVPDTLKAQMSVCIHAPMVLMSDRGQALASVVASSVDWHDALTGFGHESHLGRFGPSSYATDRNAWRRAAHTGLVSELTKHGLSGTDLHGCVNVFTKIAVDDRAGLRYLPGHCTAGDTLVLRTEQDLLLVAAAVPHPMNPADWAPVGVRVDIDLAEPPEPDDPSHTFRPESARALDETRKALL
ncbi:DUF1989 domain-containing protein [Pseudonocardia spinosispora]|uniref:DUF1989 domain-containing protein n=1 Tax=Pseudonocardia spinosispora TaxID=103441 RepID=UPI000408EFF1|nr:DUF1989 domain-containing protein [Pseudonocardia spinosispora]